ncbi:hypothetical protein [Streptomyces pimonensis]|uniref:hypothetical protein n=1 Tax=Streptomyces pimonensis TaxID=2860288 RepID=UPI0035270BA7
MTPLFPTDVEGAVRGSRGAVMCTPEFRPHRTAGAPARAPCGVTAMAPATCWAGAAPR